MSTAVGVDRLELLASAIAARPLIVVELDSGEPSWTDGASIFVDGGLPAGEQLVAVSVHAALLAAGSLEPQILSELTRGRSTASRYLALEAHRALAAHEDVLPFVVRPRIDRAQAARSSGAAESLAIARGREPIPDAPELFGIIRPRQVRAERVADEQTDAVGHIQRANRDQTLRELDDGEDVHQDNGFDTLNPVGASGTVGKLLQRFLGSSRSQGKGTPGADAATHRTKSSGRVGRGATVSSTKAELPDEAEVFGSGTATYPEWNVFQHGYRPDWCAVTDADLDRSDGDEELELRMGREVHDLRRSLARLGLDLERHRRQAQGDDLDLDAVVESRVEVAAGLSPDETVYVDTIRSRRELSVLVLLDISGSGRQPSPSGGSVHEHHVTGAAALTAALEELGDRVALYGFRSQGRSSVQVAPVKRFDERFDARARRRLTAITPAGYTRMGAAIRHGAAVLEDRGGTVRRLLIVLSDGFAYDHGYEGDYAQADARRALAEARRRGTACLCLSIGAGNDAETLRRVFGTAAYAGFGRVDQMAKTAGPLFLSALRLAEQQRRTSQRRERTRERIEIERKSA